jgi:hypothetical protein
MNEMPEPEDAPVHYSAEAAAAWAAGYAAGFHAAHVALELLESLPLPESEEG